MICMAEDIEAGDWIQVLRPGSIDDYAHAIAEYAVVKAVDHSMGGVTIATADGFWDFDCDDLVAVWKETHV